MGRKDPNHRSRLGLLAPPRRTAKPNSSHTVTRTAESLSGSAASLPSARSVQPRSCTGVNGDACTAFRTT